MKTKATTITIFLFLLSFATGISVQAQSETNVRELERIAAERAISFQQEKQTAIDYANQNNIPVIFETDEGVLFELQRIDQFGQPQYYTTQNSIAAATISTSPLHPGGSSGLNLDGTGITIREWDGGAVLTTHQEYTGRVVMGDGASSTHYHSTHVAGTMIASGVDASAKGMAPNADLRAFDWNSDESEMATEAAAGALMSNHSYGYGRGWVWTGSDWQWYGNPSISTTEDYLFGFYDDQAESWDQIAQNAPYYLIVKSAGNDRGDGPVGGTYPQDGPYDCISHSGLSKNILTIAAVEDIPGGYSGPTSVVMSSFSSWGPCDDGRIKPDISTNGVGLYSTNDGNNADYTSLSGTSMAAPSACGSLALLQEHYENQHGSGIFMKAATLKALIINTADEAGSDDGPDYKFGWGLMNTEKAAEVISADVADDLIDELTLSNGTSHTQDITVDGTEPLKVTIVWSDVPGTPVSAQLDPTNAMLVNDLDLRITSGGSTYYPWKLDINNPSDPATNTGENNVDNVEVVYVASPPAGTYTITVDHDGTLSGGSQDFSIVITGAVTTPITDPPVADFSANNTSPYIDDTVSFTDLSTNAPIQWSWTFSPSTVTFVNGTSASSKHPEVTFDAAGSYSVTLVATNAIGSDSEVKSNYITASMPPPIADFSASNTTPNKEEAINFTDLSANAPTSWSWTFTPSTVTYVNGTSASSQNPQVEFTESGIYTVELNISSAHGSDSETKNNYITVIDTDPISLPWAEDFESAVPTLTYNVSTAYLSGIPQWAYEKTGNGRLRLEAGSGFYHGGSKAATLDADPAGVTSVNSLIVTLNMSNYSSEPLMLDFWYMHHGEESHSNDRVWVRGSDSDAWIEVYDLYANQAAAGIWKEVTNLDISSPLSIAIPPQSVTSSFQIRFGQEDNYPATTTTASDGYTFDDITLNTSAQPPVVDFTADLTSGTSGAQIQFTDLSALTPTQWNWNFPGGEPSSSTDQHPSVVFNMNGKYDVTLMAANAYGSASISKADYIIISESNTLFYDDFESLTGWSMLGEFQIAAPGGYGGEHGNADPSAAYEGSQVLGVDLTGMGIYPGDYEINLGDRQYEAVSPVINCEGYASVILSFQRWLNVEGNCCDHVYIDVYDGSSWQQIWTNDASITDNSWQYQEFDISSIAANKNPVQIRFTVGSTDGSWLYSGWNIDSLSVVGYNTPVIKNVSWTGSQDDNWNNPANWSNGTVPDEGAKVLIPQYKPGSHYPSSFSVSGNRIQGLDIEPGAVINLSPGDTLIIINQ